MDIREYREYKAEDVLRLYASVGWTAYTDDPAALERGFRHSLLVLAACKRMSICHFLLENKPDQVI